MNDTYVDAETFTKITNKNMRSLASASIRLASDVLSAGQFNILSKLINGQSIEEIAKEFNRSEASIRSSIAKAMKVIRKRLSDLETIKPKFIDFKNILEEQINIVKKESTKEIEKLHKDSLDEKKSVQERMDSLFAEKNAEIDSLKREVDNLSYSLNELKKLSLPEQTKKLCDDIINDVKDENLELQVKVELLNKTVIDLKKENSSIRRENLFYDWLANNYDFTEDLSEKIYKGEILNSDLSDFSLSARAMNVVKKLNITKLGELALLKKSDLMEVQGCGKTTIEELDDLLDGFNLSFNYSDAHEDMMIYDKYKKAKEEFDKKYPLDKMVVNKQKE